MAYRIIHLEFISVNFEELFLTPVEKVSPSVIQINDLLRWKLHTYLVLLLLAQCRPRLAVQPRLRSLSHNSCGGPHHHIPQTGMLQLPATESSSNSGAVQHVQSHRFYNKNVKFTLIHFGDMVTLGIESWVIFQEFYGVKLQFSKQCTVPLTNLQWFNSEFRQKICLTQHPRRSRIPTLNGRDPPIELPSLWVCWSTQKASIHVMHPGKR